MFIETRFGSLVSEISVSQNGRSDDGPEVESPAQPRRNDLDPDGGRVRRERVDVGVRAESKTKKNVRRVWNLGNWTLANWSCLIKGWVQGQKFRTIIDEQKMWLVWRRDLWNIGWSSILFFLTNVCRLAHWSSMYTHTKLGFNWGSFSKFINKKNSLGFHHVFFVFRNNCRNKTNVLTKNVTTYWNQLVSVIMT